ncbi:MAG: hypothetical protein V8T85_11610 [Blautia faecicola]
MADADLSEYCTGEPPKGEDYLTWFLTEEQEGNAGVDHLVEQEKNVPSAGPCWAGMYRVRAGFRWSVRVAPHQMVEGKPAYQVGTSRQDDGLQAAEGTGNGSSKKEEPEEDKDLPGLLANIVLVILYGGFFLYLLLELQRAIRVQIRRDRKKWKTEKLRNIM